jgi:hypothetical protein
MILLAITGGINNGKTTLAHDLALNFKYSRLLESSEIISRIADALNFSVAELPDPENLKSINDWLTRLPIFLKDQLDLNVPLSDIKIPQDDFTKYPERYSKLCLYLGNVKARPELSRQKINTTNKPDYRPILQWLGGYLVQKISPTIWFTEITRQTRLESAKNTELVVACAIKFPSEAELIRSVGGKILEIVRPGLALIDQHDYTESRRKQIKTDCVIKNNGTLIDLTVCVAKISADLKSGKMRRHYECRTLSRQSKGTV